jgi:hypothetical protein
MAVKYREDEESGNGVEAGGELVRCCLAVSYTEVLGRASSY